MKKEIFLLFMLLFVASCTTTTNPGSSDLLTGSPDGIHIKFLPELPSNDLFEGSDVSIGLELSNNAACDSKGKLFISDTVPSSRGGISESLSREFDLFGATIEQGKKRIEKNSFYFKTSPYSGLDRPEGLDVTLEATAIYHCQIIAGPQICIRSNLEDDKSCTATETISGGKLRSTVGPVTISKVVKKFSPESGNTRLVTEVSLTKMSQGYLSNEVDSQNPLSISEEDPISITIDFDGNPMECSGRDFRDGKLYWKINDNREKMIRCNSLVNVVDKVEGNLNINLDYYYKTTESKRIKITKLNGNA